MYLLVIFAFVGLAFCQKIELSEALKLLREKNYDALIYLYEVKKSQGAYVQAGLLQNPTLSVNYTGLNFGKNIVYDTSNALLSIRVDQPFELGNKRSYRKTSALHQLKATEYQREAVLRSVSLDFLDAYFQALSDRAYLDYLRQDLEDYKKILQIQEKKQSLCF